MKATRAVRAWKADGQGLRRALEAMEREAEGWLTAELRKAEAAHDRRSAAWVRRALAEIQARREARASRQGKTRGHRHEVPTMILVELLLCLVLAVGPALASAQGWYLVGPPEHRLPKDILAGHH